jgi:hypothetical protein
MFHGRKKWRKNKCNIVVGDSEKRTALLQCKCCREHHGKRSVAYVSIGGHDSALRVSGSQTSLAKCQGLAPFQQSSQAVANNCPHASTS